MRVAYNRVRTLDVVPIEEIELNPKSRDDIPRILAALKELWMHQPLRDNILSILEEQMYRYDYPAIQGLPDMNQAAYSERSGALIPSEAGRHSERSGAPFRAKRGANPSEVGRHSERSGALHDPLFWGVAARSSNRNRFVFHLIQASFSIVFGFTKTYELCLQNVYS